MAFALASLGSFAAWPSSLICCWCELTVGRVWFDLSAIDFLVLDEIVPF